jgi:cell division septum initiation protein DivIVA
MTDSRLKGRVKGLFAGTTPDNELMDHAPAFAHADHEPDFDHDSNAERQALQVLVLARRTADEHVAVAQRQAGKIREDAQARAEAVVREAQAHAEGVRKDAEKVLTDSQAKADQMAQLAQSNAEAARHEADKFLKDARAKAGQIVKGAQANAEELDREAQARYQDVVGSLEPQRTALQQQIAALQQFEREYRARLVTFMQSQLRALGVDDQTPPQQTEPPEVEQDAGAPSTAAMVD